MIKRRPVLYDLSRLVLRVLNRTPNGIDRVDFALASHFLGGQAEHRSAVVMTALGPRVLTSAGAREMLSNIQRHWGEGLDPAADPDFARIVRAIDDPEAAAPRISKGRSGQYREVAAWIRRHGLPLTQRPADFLNDGGAYVNVSQFALWIPPYLRWLPRSKKVDGVFFIHDLLPMEMPEYFRKAEASRFQRRLGTLAQVGRAAVVSTHWVKESLLREMANRGRPDFRVLVAPIPPDPVFAQSDGMPVKLTKHPYFVMCGTIEPRKNHLLVLHIWRDLVARLGDKAPKLVVVGEYGWENEQILDLLERSVSLKRHVIVASGMPTQSLKRLVQGARALLMPSFGEGYGLPIVEALSAGVPVIASRIPAFMEIASDHVMALDPTDGPAWRGAIEQLSVDGPVRSSLLTMSARYVAPRWEDTVESLEGFLDDIGRGQDAA